jgi:hypothetical protein
MAFTRANIKSELLLLLNKTTLHPGFYTDEKQNSAVQEAVNFVAVEMFLGDEGWRNKVTEIDTTAGAYRVLIPSDVAMIKEVRYKNGDIFYPLNYSARIDEIQTTTTDGPTAAPSSYGIVEGYFRFNPPLSEGGTGYLQVEYMSYPTQFTDDTDALGLEFDLCMFHYMKYRAASIMAGSIQKATRPWAQEEVLWYGKLQAIVTKRNLQSTRIRDYEGW